MPDWDEDSPQLRENLTRVLGRIRDAARRRELPTAQAARHWHAEMMQGLDPRDPDIRKHFRGVFRGERGLDSYKVRVGPNDAIPAEDVAAALRDFERHVQREVRRLDAKVAPDAEPDAAALGEILNLCAWAHAEWVRIHPFANGNGRTARMWANSLALCVTAYPRLYVYDRGPTMATVSLDRRPCVELGNPLRRYFEGCSRGS